MKYAFNTDYTLENFILQTQWEDLPAEVQARAVVCGIDLMLALLLGSRGRQFFGGLNLAAGNFKEGNIPVVGCKQTFGLLGATVALSHAANSFDIDDGHNLLKGHPGASFVAGVLAAALQENISYKEYLTTLVVCYEVTIRCGLALQDHYKYLHSTGAYGAYGTAAGMGRILGLSANQLNNALSIAEFHAPLTPVMRSVQHPSMNKDGVPFGALVGATAVLETLSGSTGYGQILELPEYGYLVDSLGKKFEIMNLYFKPFTCCRWAQQPIQACLALAKEYKFTPADIEAVKVHTFKAAVQLSKNIPTSTDEAQYNIAWPVASALVCGDVGIEQVWEPALNNEKVLYMMNKLAFEVDSLLEALFPQKRLAWVEIVLKNGQILQSQIYAAPGEAADNVDLDWITKKFMLRTAPILGKHKDQHKQKEVLQLFSNCLDERMVDVVNRIN